MDDLDKYLRNYSKQNLSLPKDLAQSFIEIIAQAGKQGLQSALLDKLQKTEISIFQYLRSFYDFLLYLQESKIDKNKLLHDFALVQSRFITLKEFKDLIVRLFANQFPLKSIIQRLLQVLPIMQIQSQVPNGMTSSNTVDIIAAKFGKSTKWLIERLKSINIDEHQYHDLLNVTHNPIVKSIYCKDLCRQTVANDISHQSKQILSEQIWLYNFDMAGEHWPNELTTQLKSWNQKNSDFNIRLERIQNFYLKVIDSLLHQEQKNGLSSEVLESIKKNLDFIKSTFVNCLVISIWITKRKMAWDRILKTFGLSEAEKEAVWKSISLIVRATSLNMPDSLKLFMFYHQHQFFVTKLKIKDYIKAIQELQNNPQLNEIKKLMLQRNRDHVCLRMFEFNKLYNIGQTTSVNQNRLVNYEVSILESYEQHNTYRALLHEVTVDQLLICCIYSGVLLVTGRVAISFNEILSKYNKLIVKQQQVETVAPDLNIIQFYNQYFIKDIANQNRIRKSINDSSEFEFNKEFMYMLIHNDLTKE